MSDLFPELALTPADLTQWRWIVINSSGGKDSQTALLHVMKAVREQGVDPRRVVVSHQCLGAMEWPGTLDLVRLQAKIYGLRLEISKYRNKDLVEMSLLEYVKKRGKWPDSQNRYCTSDHKRGPGGRILTRLAREAPGPILNIFGFRAEESPARAKKKAFARNARMSTERREVWDWLPIHEWTESEVWESIHGSGVPYHFAYDLGMPRLSCVFCIFAPRDALLLAGIHNPALLDLYCDVELAIGHTFQNGRSINSIRDAIMAGEQPKILSGAWNM
jgi:3'-phosphoadenosine 5'-phosphosulfate sulfotransferase (PAPS reductase)/FAD synthetase